MRESEILLQRARDHMRLADEGGLIQVRRKNLEAAKQLIALAELQLKMESRVDSLPLGEQKK